jgi:hypothetical protein
MKNAVEMAKIFIQVNRYISKYTCLNYICNVYAHGR